MLAKRAIIGMLTGWRSADRDEIGPPGFAGQVNFYALQAAPATKQRSLSTIVRQFG
jgi:hypothetical protein